jgi:3-hydroxybutyryl-CoA dehydrogenase
MALIEQNLELMAEFGRAERSEIPAVLGRIHPTTELASAAKGVDFALETVSEVVELKRQIFSELSDICPGDAVLASNTSSLNIAEIADVKNPERLLVAHWWLPAHILPLVDVIPGPDTSPEVVSFTAELMRRLGKSPIVMKQPLDRALANRIQMPIGMAVGGMLEEGSASPEDIDRAVKMSLGIRLPILGVVQSMDFTGLDTISNLMKGFGISNRVVEEKCSQRHFGTKTSRGIYDYGGRSEREILEKRDRLFLKMLDFLEEIDAFEPV